MISNKGVDYSKFGIDVLAYNTLSKEQLIAECISNKMLIRSIGLMYEKDIERLSLIDKSITEIARIFEEVDNKE